MSLMTCSKCGKEYSDKAISCPKCGKSNKDNRKRMTVDFSPKKILVLSCTMFVLALLFSAYGATRFMWREFGLYKRQYEVHEKLYLENINNSEDAEYHKEYMDYNKTQMCKSITIATVAFVGSGTLIFIGVSLLREDKKASLKEFED